jgi:hypothetical protein
MSAVKPVLLYIDQYGIARFGICLICGQRYRDTHNPKH